MPKVMYDKDGHRCQRMYGREFNKGKTRWNRTDFYYCPICKKAFDERELEVKEVEVVRVLGGMPISVCLGEIEVPKGTMEGCRMDKNGVFTGDIDDLRMLIGEEVDKRLKARKGRKKRGE